MSANGTVKIHTVRGSHRVLISLSSRLVRLWQRTLRYHFVSNLDWKEIPDTGGLLILLWHNRLFPGIGALRQTPLGRRPLHGLVSASRDGARLSQFLKGQGIEPVRGSSSRRSVPATRELLKVLGAGGNVAITLDGPRGPRYTAQPGAALLMQITGAPTVFVGVECENCRTLKSWDRFMVPAPFSRVRVQLDWYLPPPGTRGREGRLELQLLSQERLSRLTRDLHETA